MGPNKVTLKNLVNEWLMFYGKCIGKFASPMDGMGAIIMPDLVGFHCCLFSCIIQCASTTKFRSG